MQPGKVADFMGIISRVDASAMEGCYQYDVSYDDESVVVHEVWESKEHHDTALKDPAIMALIGEAMPLLGGAPESLFEGQA